MDLECIVCKQRFLPQLFPPFSACLKMHFACIFCYAALLKRYQQGKCPECRAIISRNSINIFQPYKICDLLLQSKRKANSRQFRQLKKSTVQTISNLIQLGIDVQGCFLRSIIRQTSIRLIKQKESSAGELLLRRLIELFPLADEKEKFIGLGMKDDIEGYSEVEYCKWQNDCLQLNICLEDMLSMCYLREDIDYEQKKVWYAQMHNKFPQNQRIFLGLGITLLNGQQFQQSLEVFDKIIRQNPTFVKAYYCKFYTIIRLNPGKDNSWLNQLQAQLREMKIYRKSSLASNLYNKAVKETNPEKKIELLQNCIKISPDYPDPQLYLGLLRYLQGSIKASAHTLINVINSRRVSRSQLALCYQQVGRIYLNYRQYYLTLHFIDQAQLHSRSFLPIIVYQKIQTLYYMRRYDQAQQQARKAIIYMKHRVQYAHLPKNSIRHKNNIDKVYELIVQNQQRQKQTQKEIELLKQWDGLNSGSECPLYTKVVDERIQFLQGIENEEECLQWYRCCIEKGYMTELARKKVMMILERRGLFQQALDELVRNSC